MKLEISANARTVMQEHAIQTYPNECCGFLYGEENNSTRKITIAREVKNSKAGNQKRRFEISGKDYLNAEKFALDNNQTLLGIYHSHPDHPAKPSAHDLKQALPFFSYIILSVVEGKVNGLTSWQLNGNGSFGKEYIRLET